MGRFADTLDEIQSAIEKPQREERVQLDYLSLKPGQSVKVQPMQELDVNSPAFNPDNGKAFVTWYHQSPYNWRRSALCTAGDGGRCLACELNNVDKDAAGKPQPWYAKKRFFINLLVINDDGSEEVKVFNCSTSGAGILPSLLEWYRENGPISETVFTLTRKGSDRDTSYTLTPSMREKARDLSGFEVQDAKTGAYLEIPYERQANFYEYKAPSVRAAEDEDARISSSIDW